MPETPEWMARVGDAKRHFEEQCVDSANGRRARMAVIGLDALAREPELLDKILALEELSDRMLKQRDGLIRAANDFEAKAVAMDNAEALFPREVKAAMAASLELMQARVALRFTVREMSSTTNPPDGICLECWGSGLNYAASKKE